ncbi:MAG: intermembrane transport protein PqiB [Xanthomonadales bacterium]|nr:intermembrane transport protein PqiB [Xanthomonadales bacterium]
MNDPNNAQPTAARVAPLRKVSALWLLPLITLLVGGWMVYDDWSKQGPQITIEFASAEGLEKGKTKIKTLEVEVGQVEEITLNKELDGVLITARIDYEFKHLLADDSLFWVVQPNVSRSGVSGLGTILTGQYIQFTPGKTTEKDRHFRGLDSPPITPVNTPGIHLRLVTQGDFYFSRGDFIHYQGIRVGKVEEVDFNFAERKIYYQVFIEAPYHQLISSETRFWKASGIRAELTGSGFELDVGPIDSLILGGLSFTVPDGKFATEPVAEETLFYVYPNSKAIFEKHYLYAIQYWVLVEGNLGGLNVGAPVMHRGLQVGKVLRTDYIPEGRSLLDKSLKIPILIEINPGRLGLPDSEESLNRATIDINKLIKQSLVATIKSQNFLLGSRMVDLLYDDKSSNEELIYFNDLVVIPTGVNTLVKFTDGVEEFLDKVNDLPVTEVMAKLETLLDEGAATMLSIRQVASSADQLLASDRNAVLIEQLSATLVSIESMTESFAADSQANRDLQRLLQSAAALLDELTPLMSQLKNQPNGLIFPTQQPAELEPQRKQP